MMAFTPEHISELKSLFIKEIGQIIETSSIRLLPLSEPCLAFSGEGIRQENDVWILDFGEVPSISKISRTVSVQNAGQIPLCVGVQGGDLRIGFQWKNDFRENIEPGGDFQEMEIVYRGKELTDKPLDESITFIADFFPDDQTSGFREEFVLRVIAAPHTDLPLGVFDFNGLPDSNSHDFGVINPSNKKKSIPDYCLSIANSGNKTLTFHLDQIPDWLNISTEPPNILSETGKGAIEPGNAACMIRISPRLSLGLSKSFQSRMILETNEFRSEFKRIEMEFHCRRQISGPYIRPGKEGPIPIQALTNTPKTLVFPIENLGEQAAEIRFEGDDLIEAGTLIVPAAGSKEPGRGVIKTRIQTEGKKPEKLNAALKISIENNEQPAFVIPLEVDIIEIKCVPDMADFGTVSPGESPEQEFVFQVSGGHQLNLETLVSKPLKESLRFSTDKTSAMIVRLTDSPEQDSPLSEYNGPGIQIRDPKLGYEQTLHIRFRRAAPVLESGPKIDPGDEMIAGRLCPQCPYNIVLPLSERYCRFCGASLEDAEPVDFEGVNVCAKCGRQYKTDIGFCPIDGTPLTPLTT